MYAVLTMAILLTVFLAVLLSCSILARPDGPPVDRHPEVCTSMSPGHHHGTNMATGPAPYVIVLYNATYTTAKPIPVTLRANLTANFTGFLVQARSQSDSDRTEALGSFFKVPEGSQILPCTSVAGGWAHTDKDSKTKMTALWTPPCGDQGAIVFQATIVKGPENVYWEGVKSAPLVYKAASNLVSSSMFLVMSAVLWALVARL